MNKQRTANSTLAIGGVSSPLESFVVTESSVLRINFCAKKPAHRQSANRVWLESITDETSNWMLFDWWNKLMGINWPSTDALPGELVNRLVLLLMKISSGERQGSKGQSESVQVWPKWAERKWTVRWSLERARRWAKQVVTFASAIETQPIPDYGLCLIRG